MCLCVFEEAILSTSENDSVLMSKMIYLPKIKLGGLLNRIFKIIIKYIKTLVSWKILIKIIFETQKLLIHKVANTKNL